MERLDRTITAAAAASIAILGFLPIANWIPGGHEIPDWSVRVGGWWSGTAIVAGAAAVAVILTRRRKTLPGQAAVAWPAASYARAPAAWAFAIAALAFVTYVWIARVVLSAKPLLVDEIAQLFQARIYAQGALWLPVDRYPEFFSSFQVINLGGKVFSQYPAGGPAMLALGTLAGAEWLVGPLFGALSVLLFAALVRRIEPGPGTGLAATLVFAFAPFAAFMSGSYMNHVTGLTWLLVGMLGLARVVERNNPRMRDGLLMGFGFGMAATIRPVDALAFAVPAGLWVLARSARRNEWAALLASGVAIVVPVAALLWVNAQTTGAPLLLGYIAYYGPDHAMGFHRTPWGEIHTPARGLELLNMYFVRLQSYFLELPVPSLLPAIGALALTRRLSPLDRYLLLSTAIIAACYFAYWSDGFYLGPRFMFPLLPALALWTARSFGRLRERWPGVLPARGAAVAAVASVVVAAAVWIPLRAEQYRSGMLSMRWDADGAARRAGVAHALVLVRESWGAQLVARMWAAGVPANEAENQYRKSDACGLERTLERIEREGLRGPAAVAALKPLILDSARLVRSPISTDPTNRMLPGSVYTARCLERLREDAAGFTVFGPLTLAHGEDVVYARDLHARDSLLVREHPERRLYLLRPPTAALGAEPRFYPLERDSLLAAWRKGE